MNHRAYAINNVFVKKKRHIEFDMPVTNDARGVFQRRLHGCLRTLSLESRPSKSFSWSCTECFQTFERFKALRPILHRPHQ